MAIENNDQKIAQLVSEAIAGVLNKQEPAGGTNRWYTEEGFFSLDKAESLAKAAQEKALQMGIGVSIAVVDLSGNLVLFHRMENTVTASVDYAQHKAYTAAIYQWASGEMDNLIVPVSAMTALLNIDPKVTTLGGGLPIRQNGKIVGGLGISGGAIDQDLEIARHVLNVCVGA